MSRLSEGARESLRSELRRLMRRVSRIDLVTTYHIMKDLVGVSEDGLVAEAITSLVEEQEITLETCRLGEQNAWVGLVRRPV